MLNTLKKNPFYHWLTACYIVLLTLAAASCNESTELGNDFLDNDDNPINTIFTDTLTLKVQLERRDSLITSSSATQLLGVLHDPIFGTSQASMYAQLTIPYSDLTFGTNPIIDSVVLTLPYDYSFNPVYGNAAAQHNIYVYRLTQRITDTIHYSYETFGYDPQWVAKVEDETFAPTDSVYILPADSLPPQLRISMPLAIGEEIKDSSITHPEIFESSTNFKDAFYGFYIACDSTKGNSMARMLRGTSRLSVYYSEHPNDTTIINKVHHFPLTINSFNHFQHNYTGTSVAEALNNSGDVTTPYLFLQGMEGIDMNITVPYINRLGNIIINGAQLEVSQTNDLDAGSFTFDPPKQLYFNIKGDSGFYKTRDQELGYPSDTLEDNSVQYHLSMARTLNNVFVIEKDSTSEITAGNVNRYDLSGPDRYMNPYRLVAGSTLHTSKPLKLLLYYTKVD